MSILRKIRERVRAQNPRAPLVQPGVVKSSLVHASTSLGVKHIRKGEVLSEQVIHDRVVTTAFVEDLVAALIGTAGPYGTFNDYKYHASGTDGTAENAADTGLGLEVESRVTGTQGEGTSPNIYRSQATITYTSSNVIKEHGLFNADTGGTLMDRTVFADISVEADDSVQYTFTIQFNAGG